MKLSLKNVNMSEESKIKICKFHVSTNFNISNKLLLALKNK